MRILHKLKIIHKDIKPENVLFSPSYNKFVFTDFGISHNIIENLGYKTMTFYEGTPIYMGDEMKKLLENVEEYVDLYYNDVQSLKLTMK